MNEALQSSLLDLPELMQTPLLRSLIPHMHRRIEEGSELWHHWRLAIAENFYFACKTVLNTTPVSRDIMTWRTHGILCKLAEDESLTRILFEFPRKAMKSSIVTSRYPIHKLLKELANGRDPWQRTAILSYAMKTAQRHWWETRNIIDGDNEGSRLLRFLFPDLEHDKEDRWNDSLGFVKRRYNPKDPSFEAIAKRSAGKHFDLLIADDLIDEENYDSPDAVENAVILFDYGNNWLEGADSRYFVVGNRWGMLDLNATIHKQAPANGFVILSVNAERGVNFGGDFSSISLPDYALELAEEMNKVAEEKGTIWPERFSKSYLRKLASSPKMYASQYLNCPEDTGSLEFDISLVRRGHLAQFDKDFALVLDGKEHPIPLSSCNVYVSWDPALDEKHSRSENAIVVLANTPDNELVVIAEHVHKEDPLKSIHKFIAMCRMFKGYLKASGIEEVLFQKVLKKTLQQTASFKHVYLGLRKIKTPTNKTKDQRIRAAIGGWVESGRLFILDNCPKTFDQVRLFGVEGMARDAVDALSNGTQLLVKPFSATELEERDDMEAALFADAGITGYGETLQTGYLN